MAEESRRMQNDEGGGCWGTKADAKLTGPLFTVIVIQEGYATVCCHLPQDGMW